jgi:PKD repeat protein
VSPRLLRTRTLACLLTLGGLAAAGLGAPAPAFSLPGFNPTANVSAAPNPAQVGETVTFDGSGSTPDGLGGAITNYQWDLDGNGTYETNTGGTSSAARSYSAPGTIQVGLKVTENDGDDDEATVALRVNAPPTAGFIYEPSTPAVGEQVTFSSTASDSDGSLDDASHRWDFDEDGQFDDALGQTVTHAFSAADTVAVGLEVTDADGGTAVASRDVLVQTAPPNAEFHFSPDPPVSNETVTFDAQASTPPPGATITSMTWDLDGDGEFDDATGAAPSSSYPTPGPHTVSLRVDASDTSFDIRSRVVQVGNRAPKASFSFSPNVPRAGDAIELVSTSTDSDSPIADQEWDLDGDGEFDDTKGETASKPVNEPGPIKIGLKVRDINGATDQVTKTISVGERRLDLMAPFPVVRLVGDVLASGKTLIKRLSVRAPKGAEITVRCDGRSCPFEHRERAVRRNRVRFPGMEGVFDPRAVIEVFVTKPNRIGKYTRFKLRDDKAPKRNDSCTEGERRDPIPCPQT